MPCCLKSFSRPLQSGLGSSIVTPQHQSLLWFSFRHSMQTWRKGCSRAAHFESHPQTLLLVVEDFFDSLVLPEFLICPNRFHIDVICRSPVNYVDHVSQALSRLEMSMSVLLGPTFQKQLTFRTVSHNAACRRSRTEPVVLILPFWHKKLASTWLEMEVMLTHY